ncbi:aminomethyltransferase, mitochondrial-like [Hydractinia symbiolongicarpus]|uniref:aminomethyltransferase, mitochondrial-like n=1 Tax=Hydractinia symbiolongicarpus TaxID=13093 RepID=UPI00254C2975|nr:aminomethyltransferase, mitochondrial-like [Hydractinia symbiolongicarpus]
MIKVAVSGKNFSKLLCSSAGITTRKAVSGTRSKHNLQSTELHDFHLKHGGKMVDFAGWSMPVQYSDLGIIQSHHHTRNSASLFDVSHMLQFKLHGKDRTKCLEELVVADIVGMPENSGGLSLFMNENGGIRDDCIINNAGDHLYVVSNAGCAHKIKPLMQDHVSGRKNELDVELEFLDTMSLLAIQGPKAAKALQNGVSEDLSLLKFMNGKTIEVFGVADCRVTRCGYTGEDGFEISIPSSKIEHVAESFLACDDVKLAGLGARDTLRLEAGLCLYGNDIDESTTPVAATLLWTIAKRRRSAADFPGAEIILNQIKHKPARKRIGLVSVGPPSRGHTPVLNVDGSVVGEVTSGCPSPSLNKNIAMAYVDKELAKLGTILKLKRGKKEIECEVVKMPFLPTKYYF